MLTHGHSGIRVRIDTVGQPGRIADRACGKACLLHGLSNRFTLEQRIIQGGRKGRSSTIAHDPEGSDKETGIETYQLVGPAANPGQCPPLPSNFAGIENKGWSLLPKVTRHLGTAEMLGREGFIL